MNCNMRLVSHFKLQFSRETSSDLSVSEDREAGALTALAFSLRDVS